MRIFIILICIILIFAACDRTSAEQASSRYNKLCEIYKEIDALPLEYAMKEMKLCEMIQKQLPDFFKKNYVHIAVSDLDRKYGLIKQCAEYESVTNWECPAIITYYEGVE